MFPAKMRKSPNSLSNISEAKVIDWLLRLIDKSPSNFWKNVVKNRKYLRKNLPAHLRSMLLDKVSNLLLIFHLKLEKTTQWNTYLMANFYILAYSLL